MQEQEANYQSPPLSPCSSICAAPCQRSLGPFAQDMLETFTGIPQCLGSQHTSLVDKSKLVLLTLWMLCDPNCDLERRLAAAEDLASKVVSFTTDFGTELGLSELTLPSFQSGLPPWLQDRFPNRDEGPSRKIFPASLMAGGMLHIIHNLSFRMDESLQHFRFWLAQLQHLITLLHYRMNRERFLHACVRGTPYAESAMAKNLEKAAVPTIAQWRWNDLTKSVNAILPLEMLLRSTFRADLMRGEATADPDMNNIQDDSLVALNDQEQSDDPAAKARLGTLNLKQLDLAIRSPFFWNYCRMVQGLHNALSDLAMWAESCSCHFTPKSFSEDESRLYHTLRANLGCRYDCDNKEFTCPLGGMRAAELAAGEWQRVYRDLAAQASSNLLLNLVLSDPEDTEKIVADQSLGISTVFASLEGKLAHWKALPWRLCALAHPDRAVAATHAESILHDWQAMDRTATLHHPLTMRFLSSESPLLPELTRFADGEALESLPILEPEVARLKWISVCERRVRGRLLKLCLTAPNVSLGMCVLRLEKLKCV